MKRLHISPLSFVFYPLIAYFFGVRLFLMFFLSVIFHEAGHLLAIYCFRQKVVSVTLSVGGLDIRRYGNSTYRADAVIALCGPLFGFLVGSVGLIIGYADFFFVSTAYTLLNILPVYPLDGGCFFRSVLFRYFEYEKAHRITRTIGLAVLFAVYVSAVMLLLFTEWNASLLVICICIFSLTCMREKI